MLRFLLIIISMCIFSPAMAGESICYGTTKNGHIDAAVQIPASGKNFISYSKLAGTLGRTYVHSKVRDIILHAYEQLAHELPNKRFKYAETGFKKGGKFSPHKTHQNGLSVDFMVPVMDPQGKSTHFTTNAFNKYGYNVEFDKQGHYKDLTIDFEALAAHIVALDKSAKHYKLGLWRVIFDPKLQPYLLKTRYGAYIKQHINLSKKRSWVRHDEHYHVDFAVPCKNKKS